MAIAKKNVNVSNAEACAKQAEMFFASCNDAKDARKEMRIRACQMLLACSNVAAFALEKVEGLNKANISRLSRMIASSAKLELAYDAKARALSVKVVDARFTSEERVLLQKGKFPKKFTVEKEIDLDAVSRRIQSLLRGLSSVDRQAVLDDATAALNQVEQA